MSKKVLANTIQRCRDKNVIIPTYEEMKHPEKIPPRIRKALKGIGLWDLNPLNLFRITWKNDVETGGFGRVNFIEFPPEITGVKARIFALVGKFFPTGAHKVGATFGPLVSRLVKGEFDPTRQKAVWPSTGNYCRGGAYDSYLLGCHAIAILPQGMSRERFEWLKTVGAEVIATPGTESNVKEIYDKCWELKKTRGDEVVVLNQFEEFGNPIWHYEVTSAAMLEVLEQELKPGQRLAGVGLSTGSAGTIGCADALRKKFPTLKVAASEALECPTLLYNGYGAHRIEGIGDKHIPWIHNVKNTDVTVGIKDEDTIRIIRLFNEPAGKAWLARKGVSPKIIEKLALMGISSVCNLLTAVKLAKYYEMNGNDAVFTICTDSIEMYRSRLKELNEERGKYTEHHAAGDYEACLMAQHIDHMQELSYWDRRRVHNLKYFTWVEQQGKTAEELDAQWFDEKYWDNALGQARKWDRAIGEFNDKTGVAKKYK
jgi:cysteine synthase